MKTFLCTIFNSTTGHHSPPLVFETKEQAVTLFINETLAENSELFPIKNNLHVKCIGTYEHTTGKISSYLRQKNLISGIEIKEPQQKKETV